MGMCCTATNGLGMHAQAETRGKYREKETKKWIVRWSKKYYVRLGCTLCIHPHRYHVPEAPALCRIGSHKMGSRTPSTYETVRIHVLFCLNTHGTRTLMVVGCKWWQHILGTFSLDTKPRLRTVQSIFWLRTEGEMYDEICCCGDSGDDVP